MAAHGARRCLQQQGLFADKGEPRQRDPRKNRGPVALGRFYVGVMLRTFLQRLFRIILLGGMAMVLVAPVVRLDWHLGKSFATCGTIPPARVAQLMLNGGCEEDQHIIRPDPGRGDWGRPTSRNTQ
jgi:hypothetical protein